MNDSLLPPEIQREFEKIHRRYITSLPDKARRLTSLKANGESSNWKQRDRAALKELTHQLSGSLGTFGLNKEQVVSEALDVALQRDDQEVSVITPLLDDLIELLLKKR